MRPSMTLTDPDLFPLRKLTLDDFPIGGIVYFNAPNVRRRVIAHHPHEDDRERDQVELQILHEPGYDQPIGSTLTYKMTVRELAFDSYRCEVPRHA